MTEIPDYKELGAMVNALKNDTEVYFNRTEMALQTITRPKNDRLSYTKPVCDHFWIELPGDLQKDAMSLAKRLLDLAGHIAEAVRKAPLTSEADQRDVMMGIKVMPPALLLRRFQYSAIEVLHDEGDVLVDNIVELSDDNTCALRDH